MSKPSIEIDGIGKRYRIRGQRERYLSLRDEIAKTFRRLRIKDQGRKEDFWALRDVSFSVNEGEAVGIIGRNGAGKSTLLKILTRITPPTEGRVTLRGRVASLLEVGTGFHPELTGRENIYLNGAILGMSRAEVKRKFDEIVAFSEVEKFLDMPVKRYSSGMYVRLAFSVAAHLEPEILLVDEVLAVGDATFQRKCLGKMGDVTRAGRTVLFVSHNLVAVQSLCRSAVWVDRGAIVREGECSQVVAEYLRSSMESDSSERIWDDPDTAPGNEVVRLHRAKVCPDGESPSGLIAMDTPIRVEVEFWNRVQGSQLSVVLHILNEQGVTAFSTGSDPAWRGRPLPVGLYRSTCRIPGHLLNSGTYRVRVFVYKDVTRVSYHYDDVVCFDVVDLSERQTGWHARPPGLFRPLLGWATEYVEDRLPVPRAVPHGRGNSDVSRDPAGLPGE
jgi:lipopolysaccharide transport system ATP-binding protein